MRQVGQQAGFHSSNSHQGRGLQPWLAMDLRLVQDHHPHLLLCPHPHRPFLSSQPAFWAPCSPYSSSCCILHQALACLQPSCRRHPHRTGGHNTWLHQLHNLTRSGQTLVLRSTGTCPWALVQQVASRVHSHV